MSRYMPLFSVCAFMAGHSYSHYNSVVRADPASKKQCYIDCSEPSTLDDGKKSVLIYTVQLGGTIVRKL
jgi:hypothetical protein